MSVTPPESLTTISPTTNKPLLRRVAAPPTDIALLPSLGQNAFQSFRKSHPTLASRQEIVAKALKLVLEKQDELAKELTEQMGRPISYAAKEIQTAVKRAEYLNSIAGEVLGKDVPGQEERGFRRFIRREPVGVVLVLFAWNVSPSLARSAFYISNSSVQYPYLILVNSLIPAILAGNAVIIKPSPQTPTIAEQMTRIFTEAGLPPKVLQYFHCGSIAYLESIVRAPLINHICFTGSVAGGLAVQRAASERIVNVGLELGGKDPAYIRADVDPVWAAEEIVDGAIFNSGQSCCAIERVYVHADIYYPFISAVKRVLSSYKVGDPADKSTQIGPVISKRAKETVLAQIASAIKAGARDETPTNNETFNNLPTEGNFVKPTLLTGCTHAMSVMTEETFGPVIPVMKVTSDEHAIKLMNDSEFGLTASIWTKDDEMGEIIADSVEAGTVFVNRADYPSPVSNFPISCLK